MSGFGKYRNIVPVRLYMNDDNQSRIQFVFLRQISGLCFPSILCRKKVQERLMMKKILMGTLPQTGVCENLRHRKWSIQRTEKEGTSNPSSRQNGRIQIWNLGKQGNTRIRHGIIDDLWMAETREFSKTEKPLRKSFFIPFYGRQRIGKCR